MLPVVVLDACVLYPAAQTFFPSLTWKREANPNWQLARTTTWDPVLVARKQPVVFG